MALSFAHVVNPVCVHQSSDLFAAQPITFESIRIAKSLADSQHQIVTYAVAYDEDQKIIPDCFDKSIVLKRSVLDLYEFKPKRKLPLLADILNLVHNNGDEDFIIFSNVDIALQPYFYNFIIRTIESGTDAFVINRRTISKETTKLCDLPVMMAQVGEPHKGFDCFVFKRSVFPDFYLADVCIGINMVGKVLVWNLALFAAEFREYNDVHLTFHLGNDKSWLNQEYREYEDFNRNQARMVIDYLSTNHREAFNVWKSYNLLKPPGFFQQYYPHVR